MELRQTQVALQSQAYQARAFQAYDNHMDMANNPELDAGFYESTSVRDIKHCAPGWRNLGMTAPRPAFKAEVDRILADPGITGWD